MVGGWLKNKMETRTREGRGGGRGIGRRGRTHERGERNREGNGGGERGTE